MEDEEEEDEGGVGYVDEAAAYAAAKDTVLAVGRGSVQRKLVDDPREEFDEFGVVDDVPPF